MSKNLIQFKSHFNFNQVINEKLNKIYFDKKTVLFIEPYGAVISMVNRGFINNFNIIILTADKDFRVISEEVINKSKIAIHVDTADSEAVKEVVLSLNSIVKIDAVIPGFEYFVPLASMISELINAPGISHEKVMNLRRKDMMRSILKSHGLNIPNYYLVSSKDDINRAANKIGFPSVCKPIDAAGSVNVKKVNDLSELTFAANRILDGNDVLWGYKLSNALLVEEYIDGKEYSLEGIIKDNHVTHFSLTEKFVSDQSEFIEVGHIVNSPVDGKLKQEIEQYVNNVINVLGANNCPFHAEVRIRKDGEPVLMEIAARLAGDKIGDLINIANHINYFDYVYAAYLGQNLPDVKLSNEYAGIRFFYRPEIESYSTVDGVDQARKLDVEDVSIYYLPKVSIPAFPKPLRRLGHVVAKSNSYEELLHLLDSIDSSIVFDA